VQSLQLLPVKTAKAVLFPLYGGEPCYRTAF